jgi:hypothetical protein
LFLSEKGQNGRNFWLLSVILAGEINILDFGIGRAKYINVVATGNKANKVVII